MTETRCDHCTACIEPRPTGDVPSLMVVDTSKLDRPRYDFCGLDCLANWTACLLNDRAAHEADRSVPPRRAPGFPMSERVQG